MSSAPNAGWPKPAAAPSSPGPSLGWRIRHSWWLLLPIFGFGCLGGPAFLYVGLRAGRPAWWIAGTVYTLVGWAGFIATAKLDEDTALSDWTFVALLVVWIAGIVHACLINESWLRWQATHRPWYTHAAAALIWPGAPYPPGSAAPPPGTHPGPRPVAARVPPSPATGQPPAQPVAPRPWGQAIGPVDVNTATYEQLLVLPNFTAERAQRVLAERQERHGFGTLEEFAAAANLAPHEFAHVRNLVVCAPPQPGSAGHWGQPPQGLRR